MTQAAKSITLYSNFFRHREASVVLDYGAGKLRNALYLAGRGFAVYAADLPEQVSRFRSCPAIDLLAGVLEVGDLPASRLNVDLVLSTYVFNIITEVAERQRYLDNIVANLRPGGYLLIELRCRRAHGECGNGCPDYFKSQECAKTYSHEELDRILIPCGFRRLSHYYRHQALAAIYQLAGYSRYQHELIFRP